MTDGKMEKKTVTIEAHGDAYAFSLHQKRDQEFGPAVVDHLWMDATAVYSQRRGGKASRGNFAEILRFFWDAAIASRAQEDRNAQEKYLLGALLPVVRSHGSRKAFDDARMGNTTSNGADEADEFAALEQMLQQSSSERMTPPEFNLKTERILFGQSLTPEYDARHDELTAFLLDDACRQLGQGAVQNAQHTVRKQWDELQKKYGKRAGHATEKAVLNAISYEARVAMHQAYSVVWYVIQGFLGEREEISEMTQHFLRVWHTDFVVIEGEFPMFHGHVFALHPASGLFMQTATGPRLLGEFLMDPAPDAPFERFLHAMLIAIYAYKSAIDGERSARTIREVSGLDLEEYPVSDDSSLVMHEQR